MAPSKNELAAVLREEAEALEEFARASAADTKAGVRLMAARKRLSLARSSKWALTDDLMTYAPA